MFHQRVLVVCVLFLENRFYTGTGWDPDPDNASIFTPFQAERTLRELKDAPGVTVRYLLQNRAFDFYDGERWRYHVSQASFYPLLEAQALAQELSRSPA